MRDQPVQGTGFRPGEDHRLDAGSALTLYLVLLLAVPSSLVIAGLGGLGRPSVLWGLVLMLWWLVTRLQARESDGLTVSQPVRFALGAFAVVVLVSFASALFRGQPADQVSPAVTALLRLISWSGVLLVAMDGLGSLEQVVRLVRRLAIAAGLLAGLGLVQFVTGQTMLDWWGSIPGLQFDTESAAVAERGEFARAAGTAIHPLEYAAALASLLPIAIVCALSQGCAPQRGRFLLRWWVPVVLVCVSSMLSVSRSAIVGFAVALIASLPAVPKRFRLGILLGGVVGGVAVMVVVPGMLTTMLAMFLGVSDDPSTQSRTTALARVPEFVSASPLLGAGFGTFLPRYYIFDNQWVLILVELGILGVAAFAGLFVAAVVSAYGAAIRSIDPTATQVFRALAASVITMAALLLFFDALSFPIAAGLLFLLCGLAAAARNVAAQQPEPPRPRRMHG